MGQSRQFDEQALLDHAQEEFWSQGYEWTSIADVSHASGVGNGSIYAAYGSKLGLFLAVLNRYCDVRVALVDGLVSTHPGTFKQAVADYLDQIVAECTSHADLRGCLMLNSLAEMGAHHPEVITITQHAVTAMEQTWAHRVRRFRTAGEVTLSDDDVAPFAAHVVLVSQGLIQLSRTGAPAATLRAVAGTSSRMSAAAYATGRSSQSVR